MRFDPKIFDGPDDDADRQIDRRTAASNGRREADSADAWRAEPADENLPLSQLADRLRQDALRLGERYPALPHDAARPPSRLMPPQRLPKVMAVLAAAVLTSACLLVIAVALEDLTQPGAPAPVATATTDGSSTNAAREPGGTQARSYLATHSQSRRSHAPATKATEPSDGTGPSDWDVFLREVSDPELEAFLDLQERATSRRISLSI